jgi:hypothetical protein
MEEQQFKVRDKRKKGWGYFDYEFLNGYAKYVGWQGQCVYLALCRHERDNSCYPSLRHLAIELGISESSVRRGVEGLKEWNIIQVKMRIRTERGRGSNVYYLVDKSEWKRKPDQRWSNQPRG